MNGVFDSDFFDPAIDLSVAPEEPVSGATRVADRLSWCATGIVKAAAAFTVAAVVYVSPSMSTAPVIRPTAAHAASADVSRDDLHPDRVYDRPQDIDGFASFLLSKSKKLERLDHLI